MIKFIIIKTIHTAIWLFMNLVIFYFLYAIASNKIDEWVWWVLLGMKMGNKNAAT